MKTQCPHCNTIMAIPEGYAIHSEIKCKKCQNKFVPEIIDNDVKTKLLAEACNPRNHFLLAIIILVIAMLSVIIANLSLSRKNLQAELESAQAKNYKLIKEKRLLNNEVRRLKGENLPQKPKVAATRKKTEQIKEQVTETKSNSVPIFKMGEQISVGYMSYVVDKAKWSDSIYVSYMSDIKPDSSFLIINLRTRNDDREARQIPPFHLIDENGKKYDTTSDSVYLNCDFDFLHQLNPEVSTEGCIVFDVPSNHNYWLEISGGYWSTQDALVEIKTTN